jgi:hypothetical protein
MEKVVRRLAVDKITLVELIEGETAKLSPRGRELWEEMETLVELSEGITPRDRNLQSQQKEITDQMLDLPLHEQHEVPNSSRDHRCQS